MFAELLPFLGPLVALLLGVAATALYCRQRQQMLLAQLEAQTAGDLAAARQNEARLPELEQEIDALRGANTEFTARCSTLEMQLTQERQAAFEKLSLIDEARTKFADAFSVLSSDALRKNNQSFLEMAESKLAKFQEGAKGELEKRQQAIGEMVKPVRESLDKVDLKIQEMEKARTGAYESLTTQVRSLFETQTELRKETSNLVRALRAPSVRGRWGEVQLRRVVEMAGMVEHCDFSEQQSVESETGRLRPDLLVRLPGGKTIVVDAKAAINAYVEAIEATDELVRAERLVRHAAQVRGHVEALSRKSYWEQFEHAPEFVVLFLPGEMFFSAALERDPQLIEYAADRHVILATPTTLIALLKAVFFGWRQQKLAQNAQEISALGRDLFKRLSDMGGHLEQVGRSLNKSVESYNKAVGTLESRVLVTARKFQDLEAATSGLEIEPLVPVEQIARTLQAPELLAPTEPAPLRHPLAEESTK